jgi:hypothetical protein
MVSFVADCTGFSLAYTIIVSDHLFSRVGFRTSPLIQCKSSHDSNCSKILTKQEFVFGICFTKVLRTIITRRRVSHFHRLSRPRNYVVCIILVSCSYLSFGFGKNIWNKSTTSEVQEIRKHRCIQILEIYILKK